MHSVQDVKHQLLTFTALAEDWMARFAQLELTPVESGFYADIDATHGAAVAYLRHGIYSDLNMWRSTLMAASFSIEVMRGDAHVYDHYFDNKHKLRAELLSRAEQLEDGSYRFPLRERGDHMARRYEQQLEREAAEQEADYEE